MTALPDLAHAVHVVIDMQELFDRHPQWGFPALRGILPRVTDLARHNPAATFWTRFIPAMTAETAPGSWRKYYELWPTATLAAGADKFVDLLPELKALAVADNIFDKPGFSAFTGAGFAEALKRRTADTLILSGVETDVCVWATALDAVDLGLNVVLVRDAMASFSTEAHDTTLAVIAPRFIPQITISDTTTLLQHWR